MAIDTQAYYRANF